MNSYACVNEFFKFFTDALALNFQAIFAQQLINTTIHYTECVGHSVLVSGPGITGDVAYKETYFVICQYIPDGVLLRVVITAPDGSDIDFTLKERIPGNIEVWYTPPFPGSYTVEVLLSNKHIQGSPLHVQHCDPVKCFATGKGLTNCIVGKVADFVVNCSNADISSQQLEMSIAGPTSTITPYVTEISKDVYSVQYMSTERGLHTINVLLMGSNIKGSPFTSVSSDFSSCVLSIPGSNEAVVDELFYFNVKTKKMNISKQDLSLMVSCSQSENFPVEMYKDESGDYVCCFTPSAEGLHIIEAKCQHVPITGSPQYVFAKYPITFEVTDKPTGYLKVSKEDCFVVNICNRDGFDEQLTAYSSNGEECSIHTLDSEIDSYAVSFTPSRVGVMSIEVLYANQSITGLPLEFIVNDPTKCVIDDIDALLSSYYVIGNHINIEVSTQLAGEGDLTAKIDKTGEELSITKCSEDSYLIHFVPNNIGEHQLDIRFDGVSIPQSPLKFYIHSVPPDASKVTMTLPEEFVVLKENCILVDATQAGDGYLTAYCKCDDGSNDIPVEVIKEENNVEKFKVIITPSEEKAYSLSIYWSDVEIPHTPLQIDLTPKKIIIVEDPFYCMSTCSLIVLVDCTRAGIGTLRAVCKRSTGSVLVSAEYMVDTKKYKLSFVPLEDDEYLLEIFFNEEPIPDSPLLIDIKELKIKSNPNYCDSPKVFILQEDEIKLGTIHFIGKPAEFRVCTKFISSPNGGQLDITAQGPGKVHVKIYNNNDNTYTCVLNPLLPGLYSVNVLWNDHPIKNGVHNILFKDKPYNKHKKKLYLTVEDFKERYVKPKYYQGIDLDFDGFIVGVPYSFNIDCSDISIGELVVAIKPPNAADITVTENACRKLYNVKIMLKKEGNHELLVLCCKDRADPQKHLYGGKHIMGSPFVITAKKLDAICSTDIDDSDDDEEDSDAPKGVVAQGPGLKDGYIGMEGFFTVTINEDDLPINNEDSSLLLVDVKGPEGGFKLKMSRLFDTNVYLFRYDPIYVGCYTIDVMWSSEHVNGSPFTVHIDEQ